MILGFSTQLNNKPTFFVEKILRGLLEHGQYEQKHNEFKSIIGDLASEKIIFYHRMWELIFEKNAKVHTIREDPKDRWKKGNKIDFFINVRKKDMFRFAPVLPVVSTQSVAMSYAYNDIIEISINGQQLHDRVKLLEFVQNDGFDSWEDFFNYFYPIIKKTEDNWYEAKIIHWTDLKY